MNETLSKMKAETIVREANSIAKRAVRETQDKNDEFVEKVSYLWEDKNAISFAQDYKSNMETAIQQLNNNMGTFANVVEGIANYYIRVGGMPQPVSVERITLSADINVDKIKLYFVDGNEDDFGFRDRDPKTGVEQVMDAFKALKINLKHIASEMSSNIKNIQAFGNVEVQRNLAKSAEMIITIFENLVNEIEGIIQEQLNETAKAYMNTGENAVATSQQIANGGN